MGKKRVAKKAVNKKSLIVSVKEDALRPSGQKALDEAGQALGRLQNTLDNTSDALKNASAELEDGFELAAEKAVQNFDEAMDNDFNTRDGIAGIFDFGKEVNKYLEGEKLSEKSLVAVIEAFDEFNDRLTIFREKAVLDDTYVTALVELLIELRKKARDEKNYGLADEIRDKLHSIGITIEDKADGVKWKLS